MIVSRYTVPARIRVALMLDNIPSWAQDQLHHGIYKVLQSSSEYICPET